MFSNPTSTFDQNISFKTLAWWKYSSGCFNLLKCLKWAPLILILVNLCWGTGKKNHSSVKSEGCWVLFKTEREKNHSEKEEQKITGWLILQKRKWHFNGIIYIKKTLHKFKMKSLCQTYKGAWQFGFPVLSCFEWKKKKRIYNDSTMVYLRWADLTGELHLSL